MELVRAKFIQILEINAIKQTFVGDVFFEFKIRGGVHDEDLIREGDGPPSSVFPSDTLRPSARWYLGQIEFSNSCGSFVHKETSVVTRGEDLHLRYRANGEFSEQLELEDFPFDTQELTVKLTIHCIIGGFVGVDIVPPEYVDRYVGENGLRSVPQKEYDTAATLSAPPQLISRSRFKVDSFHLHNVWDMSADVMGTIGVHAGEFPELRMTALVRRKPHFYLWNVVATMILLQGMSFSAYALDASDIEGLSGRISLTVTLVLAAGIYRSANAQFSPPVATLTLLDEYVLHTAIIIGLAVLTHAVASMADYAWLEPKLIESHAGLVLLQHLYSFVWRTGGAAAISNDLGFKKERAVELDREGASPTKAREKRRLVRAAGNAVTVARLWAVDKGKYVEVDATKSMPPLNADGTEADSEFDMEKTEY